MRLIDADALMKKADWFSYADDYGEVDEFQYIDPEDVENAPTVDAVEVVRCGNCKKRPKDVEWGMCCVLHRQTHKDDFCSYGERRGNAV